MTTTRTTPKKRRERPVLTEPELAYVDALGFAITAMEEAQEAVEKALAAARGLESPSTPDTEPGLRRNMVEDELETLPAVLWNLKIGRDLMSCDAPYQIFEATGELDKKYRSQ